MTDPTDYLSKLNRLKALKGKMTDRELRKEVMKVLGLKKSQGYEVFNQLFGGKAKASKIPKTAAHIERDDAPPAARPATFKHTGDEGEASATTEDVKTLDELMAICNVDLNEWRVDRYIVNKWATARKNKDSTLSFDAGAITGQVEDRGGMVVQPLYQVKAWLVRRKDVKDRKWLVDELRAALREVSTKAFTASPQRTGFLYEIALPDIHLGKLVWGDEVGGRSYDSNETVDLAKQAVAKLLSYVDVTKVERFLLPVGNDFFNSDNAAATTTAGTPMSEDTRWQNTFRKGTKLMREVIEYLASYAPVDVVIVQGNHDHERSFYLGETLAAWFRSHPSVTIDNSPTTRKYFKWKQVLIGMTHGNEEKHADLPLTMATERPQDWATSRWKFMQVGHFHREQLVDIKGVKVHTLPSLCATDAWHSKKAFIGTDRAAEGLLFDGDYGLVASYYFHVA